MATQKTRETLRFRYGRCLNDECENCKAKKIIEVPARKDFVCPDCGKELHECPPPKKKSNGGLIGGIAAVAVVVPSAGACVSAESLEHAATPRTIANDNIKAIIFFVFIVFASS